MYMPSIRVIVLDLINYKFTLKYTNSVLNKNNNNNNLFTVQSQQQSRSQQTKH